MELEVTNEIEFCVVEPVVLNFILIPQLLTFHVK